MTSFSSLGLSPSLLRALTDEGYTTPTPIQAKAIPSALEGRDLLGCAQTGTGKTAAFALPILHSLMALPADKSRRGPVPIRALVLSPTRELATQIAESFSTYGRHTGLTLATVFGGVSQFHQVRALQRGIDILVATPGRLMDLMQQGHVKLGQVGVFVLDEADRMLDMGFIQPIRKIASELPANRQTMLFSATMPKEIMKLADSLLENPVKVTVAPVAATASLIEQSVYMVPRQRKNALLEHVLVDQSVNRAVVFTRTKHGADRLTRHLNDAGITATAIHGNKAQNQRERALAAFRSGRMRVLVATDVAARGLDVDGITHVFNFDLPMEPEAYVHRIGRTGRAGATGIAISFCDSEERGLLRDIERLTGKRIPSINELPALPEQRQPSAESRDQRPAHVHQGHGGGHQPRQPRRGPSAPASHSNGPAPRSRDQRPQHAAAPSVEFKAPARGKGPAPMIMEPASAPGRSGRRPMGRAGQTMRPSAPKR